LPRLAGSRQVQWKPPSSSIRDKASSSKRRSVGRLGGSGTSPDANDSLIEAQASSRLLRLQRLALDCASASAHQVNDQDHQRHNEQQVDQAPAHVQAKTKQPQNQENNQNRPKHIRFLSAS
jgi:hypothetical protein